MGDAAGFGTRLRPQTWSRPKPLVSVAGKPILGHVLDSLLPLDPERVVFVTGYLGDQIEGYVGRHYDFPAAYVRQEEMRGQAHAIHLAREHVTGPVLVAFADTIFATDLAVLQTTAADGAGMPMNSSVGEGRWCRGLPRDPMGGPRKSISAVQAGRSDALGRSECRRCVVSRDESGGEYAKIFDFATFLSRDRARIGTLV